MRKLGYLDSIKHLREKEEMVIYDFFLPTSDDDNELSLFLEKEFEKESLHLAFDSLEFHSEAAVWAAKIVFLSAQLVLYRQHNKEEIMKVFPDFTKEVSCDAMFSADLCLRFLPSIISQLQEIDADDLLIPILQKIISKWHYSAISYQLKFDLDWNEIEKSKSLLQLSTYRVHRYKRIDLAQKEPVFSTLKNIFGNRASYFWKEFTFINKTTDNVSS